MSNMAAKIVKKQRFSYEFTAFFYNVRLTSTITAICDKRQNDRNTQKIPANASFDRETIINPHAKASGGECQITTDYRSSQ